MKKILLLVVFSVFAVSEDISPTYQEKTGIVFQAKFGINALSMPSGIVSDNSVQFLGGVGMSYLITPTLGFFVDLQYNTRTYKSGAIFSSTGFIDVPFGVDFNYGNMITAAAKNDLRLGAMYSIPLSDFSASAMLASTRAQGAFGLYIENQTLFPVNAGLHMGFGIWAKVGLGSVLQGTDSRFVEVGGGLIAAFL